VHSRSLQEEEVSGTAVLDSIKSAFGIPAEELLLIAGPCAVENETMLSETADLLVQCGVKLLRANVYKPRTSPYSFQGLGAEGLAMSEEVAAARGLSLVTEIMDAEHLPFLRDHVGMLQVGTRNMFNYSLLQKLGSQPIPVLLKRGFMADSKEFFLAAEHIRKAGNNRVVLCERGIRTFESSTRNTLDLNIVPIAALTADLPIIVDPSHGTGRADIVIPMALAAVAAGADGLMVEVHPNPAKALSDGLQSLDFNRFRTLIERVRDVYTLLRRQVKS
jgi:3-deoxy-7-phosphoheptulonate synthase